MATIRKDPGIGGEAGFTMVEVMVAVVMLVVGVLAILTMIDGSLASTSRTTAREQGTNLARDIIERAREVPYASTTTGAAAAAIAARLPENPAVTASTFVVERRNVTYTVTLSACSIDDPADGAGVGDATFCDAPSNSSGPGSTATGSGLATGPNVLGLPVTLAASGSLVDTVCDAVGTDTAIANLLDTTSGGLLAAGSRGAVLSVCPAASAGSIPYDATPADLRRIRVQLEWTTAGGTPASLTQTTLLTSPT